MARRSRRAPGGANGLEVIVGNRASVGEDSLVQTQGDELVVQPSHACAEDDPAVGELVDGGEHLGQQQRMAVGDDQHSGPDVDARGGLRERGQQRHRLVDVLFPRVGELAAVVVGIAGLA